MRTFRRAAGLIAALLLMLAGGFLAGGAPLAGAALLVVGGAAAVWQGAILWRERRDPYDLNRLWDDPFPEDAPEPEPDPDSFYTEDDGTLYCHGCGHAVPAPLAFCPECGRQLR
jgi:hypothetical protein